MLARLRWIGAIRCSFARKAALLRNLDRHVVSETGVPAYVAAEPPDSVAVGAGRALAQLPAFRDSLTPV